MHVAVDDKSYDHGSSGALGLKSALCLWPWDACRRVFPAGLPHRSGTNSSMFTNLTLHPDELCDMSYALTHAPHLTTSLFGHQTAPQTLQDVSAPDPLAKHQRFWLVFSPRISCESVIICFPLFKFARQSPVRVSIMRSRTDAFWRWPCEHILNMQFWALNQK